MDTDEAEKWEWVGTEVGQEGGVAHSEYWEFVEGPCVAHAFYPETVPHLRTNLGFCAR